MGTRSLSKLATPQAHYAAGFAFRRVKGTHVMQGDRVRLSRELERDMLAAAVIRNAFALMIPTKTKNCRKTLGNSR